MAKRTKTINKRERSESPDFTFQSNRSKRQKVSSHSELSDSQDSPPSAKVKKVTDTALRRRVNPESLARKLGDELVRDLDALIKPGSTDMPTFAERKEIQDRHSVDRRHIYDYFHSRGLRVVKEDRHGNLTRGRAKAAAERAEKAALLGNSAASASGARQRVSSSISEGSSRESLHSGTVENSPTETATLPQLRSSPIQPMSSISAPPRLPARRAKPARNSASSAAPGIEAVARVVEAPVAPLDEDVVALPDSHGHLDEYNEALPSSSSPFRPSSPFNEQVVEHNSPQFYPVSSPILPSSYLDSSPTVPTYLHSTYGPGEYHSTMPPNYHSYMDTPFELYSPDPMESVHYPPFDYANGRPSSAYSQADYSAAERRIAYAFVESTLPPFVGPQECVGSYKAHQEAERARDFNFHRDGAYTRKGGFAHGRDVLPSESYSTDVTFEKWLVGGGLSRPAPAAQTQPRANATAGMLSPSAYLPPLHNLRQSATPLSPFAAKPAEYLPSVAQSTDYTRPSSESPFTNFMLGTSHPTSHNYSSGRIPSNNSISQNNFAASSFTTNARIPIQQPPLRRSATSPGVPSRRSMALSSLSPHAANPHISSNSAAVIHASPSRMESIIRDRMSTRSPFETHLRMRTISAGGH